MISEPDVFSMSRRRRQKLKRTLASSVLWLAVPWFAFQVLASEIYDRWNGRGA